MNNTTYDTVLRKIRQIFPDREPEEVLAQLKLYGTRPYHQEKERVWLAILKLYDENRETSLPTWINTARGDFRDVIAWAEYPNAMKHGPFAENKEIRKRDKEQYEEWLNKA